VLDPELLDSPSVDRSFLLRPGIGYIRVNGSIRRPRKQLKDAIEKLGGDKLKGLVLDLRDNPGGVVQPRWKRFVFLKPGQKILSVKGRSIEDQSVEVPKTALLYFPAGGFGERQVGQRVGDPDRRACRITIAR
jgi:carboxyl-terminal processing protease